MRMYTRRMVRHRVRPIRNHRRFGWYIPLSRGAKAACRTLSLEMGGVSWERDDGQYEGRP